MKDPIACPAALDQGECGAPVEVLSWCRYHWRQQHEGRPFSTRKPRRGRGLPSLRDEFGRKQCARCERWRPVSDYTPGRNPDGLQSWCSPCAADYMALGRYGLTRSDILAMVAQQGGCAMCGELEPRNAGFRNGWHVDHDHACCPSDKTCGRCIRAILCADCNKLIGLARDSVERLRRAIDYLERHGGNSEAR